MRRYIICFLYSHKAGDRSFFFFFISEQIIPETNIHTCLLFVSCNRIRARLIGFVSSPHLSQGPRGNGPEAHSTLLTDGIGIGHDTDPTEFHYYCRPRTCACFPFLFLELWFLTLEYTWISVGGDGKYMDFFFVIAAVFNSQDSECEESWPEQMKQTTYTQRSQFSRWVHWLGGAISFDEKSKYVLRCEKCQWVILPLELQMAEKTCSCLESILLSILDTELTTFQHPLQVVLFWDHILEHYWQVWCMDFRGGLLCCVFLTVYYTYKQGSKEWWRPNGRRQGHWVTTWARAASGQGCPVWIIVCLRNEFLLRVRS